MVKKLYFHSRETLVSLLRNFSFMAVKLSIAVRENLGG